VIWFNAYEEKRLWVRLFLWLKSLLGFSMTYGETAIIAGPGPCQRCVGRAVEGAPSESEDAQ
jgi:alkylated DNA nucleotide flippase Atl1